MTQWLRLLWCQDATYWPSTQLLHIIIGQPCMAYCAHFRCCWHPCAPPRYWQPFVAFGNGRQYVSHEPWRQLLKFWRKKFWLIVIHKLWRKRLILNIYSACSINAFSVVFAVRLFFVYQQNMFVTVDEIYKTSCFSLPLECFALRLIYLLKFIRLWEFIPT